MPIEKEVRTSEPAKSWRPKDTVYLVPGSLLLIGGALGLVSHVGLRALRWRRCGPRRAPHRPWMDGTEGWEAARRILDLGEDPPTRPDERLANNLGKMRFETEMILVQSVDLGLVEGSSIDRRTSSPSGNRRAWGSSWTSARVAPRGSAVGSFRRNASFAA